MVREIGITVVYMKKINEQIKVNSEVSVEQLKWRGFEFDF